MSPQRDIASDDLLEASPDANSVMRKINKRFYKDKLLNLDNKASK